MTEQWKFKLSGLGHKTTTFTISSMATMADLQAQVTQITQLKAPYQKLLARGTKLASANNDNAGVTLKELGLRNRTSIMVVHNELYAQDQEGIQQIQALVQQLQQLDRSRGKAYISEMVTRICIQLDEIPMNGSQALRNMRKKALAQAEAIDQEEMEV